MCCTETNKTVEKEKNPYIFSYVTTLTHLRVRLQKGVGHMFCKSKSALVAGKVMMMRCHHFDWTMIYCLELTLCLYFFNTQYCIFI